MISILLAEDGIEVSGSVSAADALDMAASNTYELFLLDSWLPDIDGNLLCEGLRRRYPDVPVVFYSGCAAAVDIKLGLDAGASDYIVKPYCERLSPTVLRLIHESGRMSEKVLRQV
jgi:DNA-binding response OmpR family regulator